jgi:hypothetical protein
MLQLVRLTTIHPALAHLTLGGLPIAAAAYVVAAWRRSAAWRFTADATLGLTTLATVATAAFGLVANAKVAWPAGLETWRWLHLGAGAATTLALICLLLARLLRRLAGATVGTGTALVALGVAALASATGWIGGEVLVFHSGVAVRAAADGALAPPIAEAARARDFRSAMRAVRGAWAAMETELAWMLVHRPEDARFDAIAHQSQRIRTLAAIMGEHTGGDVAVAARAQTLATDADDLTDAARRRSLGDVAKGLGELGATCVNCHVETRW